MTVHANALRCSGHFMGHQNRSMPKPRTAKLETATARRKLPVRKKPFYITVSPGIALGYRRNIGGGSWSARCTGQGADWIKRIGLADDLEPADGRHVLTYWQAIDMARALARRQPGADGANRPVTVGEALDRYQRDLDSRGADTQNANRVRRHLTAALATKPVALLTMNDLRHWRDGLVGKGVAPATINRTRAGLRAALELAASLDDRITNRNAFRSGLKGLPGGKNARRVVLPDADVLRIVEAAYQEDRAFGVLVEVLAQTGARVSQVARLRCADLQADRADPRLLMPTSYKGRGQKEKQQVPVPITAALAALLAKLKGDRPDDAPLLVKSDGTPWLKINKSEHWNLFRAVAERAGFDPDEITSYALRHSSICRALLKGVPVSVVARLHDTSSREIEAHYAAYILDVTGELSRKGLLRPEAPTADNVVTLPGWRP
jgi:integrase